MSLGTPLYVSILIVLPSACCAFGDWKPADGPLKTRWAKDVSPANALPEYPRPQMVRDKWMNLNGLWQFAAAPQEDRPPIGKNLGEQILVPFAPESSLSGIMRHEQRMWYRRTFTLPPDWNGQHVLLHFEAVDWQSDVYVNGRKLGTHKGGYDPFSFDITDALISSGAQELIVGVYDGTDQGNQPRGKQTSRPRGIWYTPTSGIWQTVWLEPVPASYVTAVHTVTSGDNNKVEIRLETSAPGIALVRIMDGDQEVGRYDGTSDSTFTFELAQPKLWSPESPFLYDINVQFHGHGPGEDDVSSYFGKRTIALKKDEQGINRLFLNGQPIFMTGPLDQGFWPDGLYTAPTDEALRLDIATTKKLGFNMTRKHVKVEPRRWY